MPTERLAARLRIQRQGLGRSRRALARDAGLRRRDLVGYERARIPIPDAHLERLAAALGGLDELLADRQPLEIGDGRLVAGSSSRAVTGPDEEALLEAYVHLLASLRGTRPGAAVPLRTTDLEVLARALGADLDDVEARIVEVMGCTREEAARLHAELRRRRILVPAAGMALGLTALTTTAIAPPEPQDTQRGATELVSAEDSAPAPAPRPMTEPTTPDPERGAVGRPAPPVPPATTADRPATSSTTLPPAPPPTAPSPAAPTTTGRPPDPPRASAPPPTARPPDHGVSIPDGTEFVEVDPTTGAPLDGPGDGDAPVSIPDGTEFVEVDPTTGEPLGP